MRKFQKPTTSCKDCIFAVYDGKTQIACRLDKLESLKKHSAEIIEAYDNDKEFYVVEGLFCMWCRTEGWAELHKREDLVAVARKEMTIQYHAIVWANDSLDDLEKTIKSLYDSTIRPGKITVIRTMDNQHLPNHMIKILNKYWCCRWKLDDMVPGEDDSALDHAIKSCSLPYYAVFRAGFEVPSILFEDLNNKIVNDYLKFTVILPNKDGNGLIGSAPIYMHVRQNTIEESEWLRMSHQINKLFQYFPE